MQEELKKIKQIARQAIADAKSLDELGELKIKFLGKKGELTTILKGMGKLSAEERPIIGQLANEVRDEIGTALEEMQMRYKNAALEHRLANESLDVTLPGKALATGTKHPLTQVVDEAKQIFMGLGFEIAEGPEIESDHYNFEALNLPKDHPARDMQDTFFINVEELLRTHTTAVQMRQLEQYHNAGEELIKVICPGKVYRRDDDDATHSHQFMQCEGLVIGKDIKLSDLKGTLLFMAKKMFGENRVIRFRPSYFQFTEPSVEVDVSCHICGGKGCNVCKGTGWIEVLGAGMVHPNVLKMAGYDPEQVSGFAFGVGIERIAMLKYGIDDIRSFYTNDLRFLKQFSRFE